MKIPEALLDALQGLEGFDREAFVALHAAGEQVTSIRLNPFKKKWTDGEWTPAAQEDICADFPGCEQVPWCTNGFYLPVRPSFTLDPLFHAGCYYVQEASSMFLEQAVRTCLPDHSVMPYRVLDLCAAPGGKSTHLSALFPQGLVVANEVIKTRSGILTENSVKWGYDNIVVTSNDAADFKKLPGYFDMVLVDAPCSGSGMFRKDPDAIAEWSPRHVAHCSRRQQRILEDVWPCLKENGVLIYCTCSYSKEEDEAIVDWLAGEYEVESIDLRTDENQDITETFTENRHCRGYRFYPDKVYGEGFYISCLRKKNAAAAPAIKPKKFMHAPAASVNIIADAVQNIELCTAIHTEDTITLIDNRWQEELSVIFSALYVKKMGINAGKLIRDELVPSHDLALSCILSAGVRTLELSLDAALQYLRKADFPFQNTGRGWLLVTYKGFPLGWVKALPNRMNNYYPQAMRILKH